MKNSYCIFLSLIFLLISNMAVSQFQLDSIIAYYPFRYNALDISGNDYHGVEDGAVLTEDMFGNPDMAYNFDGYDDRIILNNDEPIITVMEFTLSVWAKAVGPGGGNGTNMIFEQRCNSASQTAGSTIALAAEDGNGNIEFTLRGYNPPSPYPIQIQYPAFPYGEWHHYVITCDTSDDMMRMFLDTDMVLIEPYVQVGNFHTNIDWVSIGAHHYFSAIKGAFNGDIDELIIFAGALDSIQIADLYNGYLTKIEEKEKADENSVYPNPAFDCINVVNPDASILELYSMNGQLMLRSANDNPRHDISGLTQGLYFAVLYNEEGIVVGKQKIIKK